MTEDSGSYEAVHIEVLEGVEAIRRRPGMYVGSTGGRGLHQMVCEALGPAVNTVLAGRARYVGVVLTADGGVRVEDDGPGVPPDASGPPGVPGIESLLTRTSTGPGPGGRDSVALSLFHLGPCVTNALSRRLTAEVRQEGTRWVQEYVRGVAVAPPRAAGPATGSGTCLAFLPDPDVFGPGRPSFETLAGLLRELAFLNRALTLSLTDERTPGEPVVARFRFPGGARDFVAFLDTGTAGAPLPEDVIGFEREDARMAGTVEAALRWRGSHEGRIRGFANSLPTSGGGVHEDGFRDGVTAAVDACARRLGLLDAADPCLDAEAVRVGLTAVVSVKLDGPEYLGATRRTLGGAEVRVCVEEAVRDRLGDWLAAHPGPARELVGGIVRRARRRAR